MPKTRTLQAKLTETEHKRIADLAFAVANAQADLRGMSMRDPDYRVTEAQFELAVAELVRALMAPVEISEVI